MDFGIIWSSRVDQPAAPRGISYVDAVDAFTDPMSVELGHVSELGPDAFVGSTGQGRLLFVVFEPAEYGVDVARILDVRDAPDSTKGLYDG